MDPFVLAVLALVAVLLLREWWHARERAHAQLLLRTRARRALFY
jgi:hypothetical protein